MILQWFVAAVHLLALPLGLGAVVVRGAALGSDLDTIQLRRVFTADGLWGLAALVWLSTGIARAFFGLEKGTEYYLGSRAFGAKMVLFVVILLLEVGPMVALIQWRLRSRRGEPLDLRRARLYSRISFAQAGLVVLMVLAATAMARGLFY